MGLREFLIPQDTVFFDLFEEQAALIVESATRLVTLTEDYTDTREKYRKIELLGQKGDLVTHNIRRELTRVFITPFEPEEIAGLTKALDEVMVYIQGAAERMLYYDIRQPDAHMAALARMISMSVNELERSVKEIRTMKHPENVEKSCQEVNQVRRLAHDLLSDAISDLVKREDALQVIKAKDIYEHLEQATGSCKDAADVLSNIAIRHA
ncbi:MAG: DUF47 family protein [Methanomicrobiales archaeon]|nr:DUF47 family protein [Methanomicrobiales archaeon]